MADAGQMGGGAEAFLQQNGIVDRFMPVGKKERS
jgi:hypothetical protein